MQRLTQAKSAPDMSLAIVRQGISEFLGTAFLTFIGASVISLTGNIASEALTCTRIVSVSLLDGFLFFVLVNLTMGLSQGFGGYLNPALSLSLCSLDIAFDGEWVQHTMRTVFFIVAQILGALAGAFMVLVAVPDPLKGSEKTGFSKPHLGTSDMQAFLLEALAGFMLAMVVLSVRRFEKRRSSVMLAIAYAGIRVLTYPLAMGFANPARSLGPAVVGGGLQYLWIYLFASPVGAIVASWVFYYLHSDDVDVPSVFTAQEL